MRPRRTREALAPCATLLYRRRVLAYGAGPPKFLAELAHSCAAGGPESAGAVRIVVPHESVQRADAMATIALHDVHEEVVSRLPQPSAISIDDRC